MKIVKNILIIIILILVIAGIGVLGYGIYNKITFKKASNPIATMEIEGFGTVKIELYPDQAPETVANFVKLSNNKFYDGLKFHRVVKDFMIQGGDNNGDGSGSPMLSDLGIVNKEDQSDRKYCIKGEFIKNGVNNTIRHEEGVISMAKSDYTQYDSSLKDESYNSAGSQFFIVTGNNTSYLNENYAAFGKVIEGIEVIKAIESVELKAEDENSDASTPVSDVIIKSIRVETNGVDYGTPKTYESFNYYDWLSKKYGLNLSN